MFVVERIYNNMSVDEFQNYIKGMHLTGSTTLQELEKQVKELLKNEVEQGYRDSITGERKEPNAEPVEHAISFEVYYGNKGTKAVPKTLQALNSIPNTKAEIIESHVVDEKCSVYTYKVITSQENKVIPHVFYNNGASSVYFKRGENN